jgi:glycerol uptake facilitator-like aquaporin
VNVVARKGSWGVQRTSLDVVGERAVDWHAVLMEVALTVGLVSTILGTASTAENVGAFSAIAVGGYVALAGLWSSPDQRRFDESGAVLRA